MSLENHYQELRREATILAGAPKVKEEIAKFDCPILRRSVLRPFVRFSYFPRHKIFWFKNFSDTDERIRNAHACFDLAEAVGWQRDFSAMEKYGVLSPEFFAKPAEFACALRRNLILKST